MDGNTLTFAVVIVALGIPGIAVYMKGKSHPYCCLWRYHLRIWPIG